MWWHLTKRERGQDKNSSDIPSIRTNDSTIIDMSVCITRIISKSP